MEQLSINITQFASLFDHAEIGIVTTNSKGEIQAANNYILNQFGYPEEELLHQKIEVLIPERFREKHISYRQDFCKCPASRYMGAGRQHTAINKAGVEFPVQVALGSYKENKEVYSLAFVYNLAKKTEAEAAIKQLNARIDRQTPVDSEDRGETLEQLHRQIEETEKADVLLKQALEKEKELNELKSKFVSLASHEFRTPLSSVLSSAYLLSRYTKEENQPQRNKHIHRIISSVNYLNEILSDFLSVEKIDTGTLVPKYSQFNIRDFVHDSMSELHPMLKKGQTFAYKHNGVNANIYLDHNMLQHIVTNLLSNAIKYSPEDSVINISTDMQQAILMLQVSDRGIGIPAQDKQNLFRRFFRSSNALNIQGTGLGLNIVKKYVELMKGSIDFCSEENKGTTFIVQFNNQMFG
jgi:PAS domain S-box-containing protein